MAAAYQTGTATSPTDLLQKLVTWLVAQGWTNNMSQADGTGWRAHLSKGGNFINLRATPGAETIWVGAVQYTLLAGIGLYTGTAYSAALAWNAQAGGPIGSGQTYTVGVFMQTPSGAMNAYHFFDDGSDNIVVVVERTAGIFTHLGWGPSLTKAGTWTGGAYFFGAISGFMGGMTGIYWPGTSSVSAACPMAFGDYDPNGWYGTNGFVRSDVDTFTAKWIGFGYSTVAYTGYTGKQGASGIRNVAVLPVQIPSYDTAFQPRQVSAMNSQANLLPVRLFVARDTSGYSLLGDIPNVFCSNGVGNGYAAASIYPLGADNYMMFPNFAVLKKA